MRYRLCTLINKEEDISKTAYIKNIDAKVGNEFSINNSIWEITEVSTLSAPENTITRYKTIDKVDYKKV